MTDQPINATSGSAAVSPPLHDAAVKDFIELLKPRVMSLVVFTGFAGMMVAPGSIHPVIAAIAILCTAIATGASGAINMWFERDLDAKMERTKNRPLPGGRMEPEAALAFGCVLAGGSVMVMGLGVNWAAAALLALADRFLRLCLHHLAQTPHAAEYCYRGCCRRLSADDRMGRCDG